MNSWLKAIASFFYIGYLPKAPGTFGSLAGLTIAWFFNQHLMFILISFLLIGLLISRPARNTFGNDDPKEFVLDEVIGAMLTVLWLPKTPLFFLAGFLLFRLFDIWKPWPIILIQKSKSTLGIIGDDLAAGFSANLILQIALKFQS